MTAFETYIKFIRETMDDLQEELEQQASGSELDINLDRAELLIQHIRNIQRAAEHL